MSAADRKSRILEALNPETYYRGQGLELKPGRGDEVMCLCPFHAEKNPSCSINIKTGLYNCYGCGAKGDIFTFHQQKHGCDFPTALSDLEALAGITPPHSEKYQDLTLAHFAASKKLAIEFLTQHHVNEYRFPDGTVCTDFHYLDMDGKLVAVRHRFNSTGDRKFRWRKGDRVFPYGVWRWPDVRQAGWCLLVEGETDSLTCWHYGLPVIGLPGKKTWGRCWETLQALDLSGIQVYLWQEPDAVDLPLEVARDITDLMVIKAPPEFKDLSEAHIQGRDVKELAAELRRTAQQVTAAGATVGQGQHQDGQADDRTFHETPFPWHVLSPELQASFQQYGRAYSAAAEPVVIYALCYIAAAVGRAVTISPKAGWREALIFWFLENAGSGEGKTHKMLDLGNGVVDGLQFQEQARYELACLDYEALTPKDKRGEPPPSKPRAYFATGYTLEGLSADLEDHPTGGMIVTMNEASVLVTGQNEYKRGKGTDREALINLWDGKPARIARAKGAIYLKGARVQFVGGIQPSVLQRIFGEDEIFLTDGTVFRCLFMNIRKEFRELLREVWEPERRQQWDTILRTAYTFGDDQHDPVVLALDTDAWQVFKSWRDDLERLRTSIPDKIGGFIPKMTAYALRFAAVLHCLQAFEQGQHMSVVINARRMQAGIDLADYFLGQAETALTVIQQGDIPDAATEPLLAAVGRFMEDKSLWQGTAAELFDELNNLSDEATRGRHSWPNAPHSMKRRLNSMTLKNWQAVGLEYGDGSRADKNRKIIYLRKIASEASGAHSILILRDNNTDAIKNQSVGSVGDSKGEKVFSDASDAIKKYRRENNLSDSNSMDASDASDGIPIGKNKICGKCKNFSPDAVNPATSFGKCLVSLKALMPGKEACQHFKEGGENGQG